MTVQSRLRIFCTFEIATKSKVGDENRVFNSAWVFAFLGFAEVHGKPICLICQKTITMLKQANLQRHHEQLHPEFKAAYPHDSDLRRKNFKHCSMGFKPTNSFCTIWLNAMTPRLKPHSKLPGILPKKKPATEGELLT